MEDNHIENPQHVINSSSTSDNDMRSGIKRNISKPLFIIVVIILIVYVIIGIAVYILTIKHSQSLPKASSTDMNVKENKKVINDGEIILEDKGQLYIFNTSSMQKSLLKIDGLKQITKNNSDGNLLPRGLTFSRDGRYLFFSYNYKFYIYDFSTGFSKILDIMPNAFLSPDAISPGGVYGIVDTGTGPGDSGKTIINIEKGQILNKTSGHIILWSPDNKIAIDRGEIMWWNLALGREPMNKSIYMGTINNNSASFRLLLRATSSLSYEPIKWLDVDNLIYSQSEYELSIPPQQKIIPMAEEYQNKWLKIFENPTVTYWKINVNNNQKVSIEKVNKPDYKTQKDSPSGKYKVLTEGEVPNIGVFIESTNGIGKVKISEGIEAIWRPQ